MERKYFPACVCGLNRQLFVFLTPLGGSDLLSNEACLEGEGIKGPVIPSLKKFEYISYFRKSFDQYLRLFFAKG